MEKKFLKSNQPFLSYLLGSTGHSAKVGRMAGAAQQVTQKGLIGFQKFLFYGVPTINQDNFKVKLGWCSDLIICLIKYQVCKNENPPASIFFYTHQRALSMVKNASNQKRTTLYMYYKISAATPIFCRRNFSWMDHSPDMIFFQSRILATSF